MTAAPTYVSAMMRARKLFASCQSAAIVAALLLAAAAAPAAAVDLKPAPVVVELFTSQGCSSCPPADAYLDELARRDGVIALSFHVDYWDYIGWPDQFASKETTARQHDYGRALKQGYVYTPEFVVDGRAHSSRPADVERLIRERRGQPKIPISFQTGPQDMHEVSIGVGAPAGGASVWLMFYDREHTVAIPRGENRGRVLTYVNVVREVRHIGTWTGKPLTLPVSMKDALTSGRDGCAVIVQEGRAGPILGAARMAFSR